MAKAKEKKQEALSVNRLINEILVDQLSIPFRQIVNDTAFSKYTGSKRPDILISEYEYDGTNEDQYIANLIAYAEAKDNCIVDDKDWKDAIAQGKDKAKKLNLPYFIVTNCKTTYFYNAETLEQIWLNGNPIREFQTIDIYRLIKNRLKKDSTLTSITTNVDSISAISEAIFNKKLWELAGIYRGINFKDNIQKIDFTVGFVALEYFEEKEEIDGKKDASKIYWSTCYDPIEEKIKANLSAYIQRLETETTFNEFKNLMEVVRVAIDGNGKSKPLVDVSNVKMIYDTINSMKPLHGTGFDLFGAVYEMFASSKEKKDFGEYFTRRHYAHIFSKLLLEDEDIYNEDNEFKIIDPACGTGGFLTESFKVLKNNYEKSGTLTLKAKDFLSQKCFHGVDVRDENISRTRLNMFLVGDGHTNMYADNSLNPQKQITKDVLLKNKYQYVITNPPYGSGTIKASTTFISSYRTEIAFICKVVNLLKVGGKACIITPDGVLENPSYKKFREELLEKCDIYAIISLPKFAFAPYTKEKTYALFIRKRSETVTKKQCKSIWMYIIDNDGLANSDKRFPTKLRNNRNGWMHDEISGWVNTDGEEKPGILETRWLKFDDLLTEGTEWINEKGIKEKLHKGGNISIDKILNDTYYTLLPEFYIRPQEPNYLDETELLKELKAAKSTISKMKLTSMINGLEKGKYNFNYQKYQATGVPIKQVITYMSGNSGLTEEFIYHSLQRDGKRYQVLSSATETRTMMGEIPMCRINDKDLKVFEDKDGLLVTRNGKAGNTRYLEKGSYTINDHAYILYIKEDCPYEINLKWLAIQYRSEFLSFTSNSDNGTWNMTGFFNLTKIDIPDIEEQKQIVDLYSQMEKIKEAASKVDMMIDNIFTKQLFVE